MVQSTPSPARPRVGRPARACARARAALLAALTGALLLCPAAPARAESFSAGGVVSARAIAPAAPDPATGAALFGQSAPVRLERLEDGVPGWAARDGAGALLGYLGSSWELAGSVGYSGRPLDVLVAITPQATIAGARLMRHSEPVLTLGISEADIARFVQGFAGLELTAPREALLDPAAGAPDVIARATVSTGVIRDGILRSARTLAIGRGLIGAGGGIDRLSYTPTDWPGLLAMGALAEAHVTMTEAATALGRAAVPVPPGPGPFLDLWAGLIDTPTVGQNLLGQQMFTQAVGALGPGESALIVISAGVQSPRGTEWKRTGLFERITVVQGARRHSPRAEDFLLVKKLAIARAPYAKEISVFRLPAGAVDPARPFRLEITARRAAATGAPAEMVIGADYTLPAAFRLAPPPEPEPLWREIWREKRPQTAFTAAMLGALTLILFAQDWIVRRPRLWARLRAGFLATTLFGLGWGLNGQLSVVQVMAFAQALLSGFRWETFLIEPVIFLLWAFVALGLLFWGRGVYCGWLCPFGALQELTNAAARRLGVKQIAVPQALHERLWVIKYTLFVAILALGFYSMQDALRLAEVEPFKTAISLRFARAWPFGLFVLALLGAGLFIERFYCRYLCPLGAGLAIPAKLKIFDWLKRRPQCGRECRLCEPACTVGAIDPLGRINPNECVLCLRCQVIYNDPGTCTVLKRRARAPVPTPPGDPT